MMGRLPVARISKFLHIAALIVALGGLLFIFIAIGIAMQYGDGKILVDFNSQNEGWLELILTIFASSIILIHILKDISHTANSAAGVKTEKRGNQNFSFG